MWTDLPLLPERASTFAGGVEALYFTLIGISSFFGLLIAGLVIFLSIRYRKRPGRRATQVEGSIPLELLWTVVPGVIALSLFAWGALQYVEMTRQPESAMDFYVTGKQWMWKHQHPSGAREINELHVPVGVPIRLTMTSEDVIHSWFVPAFRVKQDVLPGRYTTLWFEATKTGRYRLFCTEYCGTKHSEMIGWVTVMEHSEYEHWLRGAPAGGTPAESGAQLFEAMRCDTCHEAGPTQRGPSLHGLYGAEVALAGGGTVVADEAYLREAILQPRAKVVAGFQPLMPTYVGQLGEEQILQLIAYIKTLESEQR